MSGGCYAIAMASSVAFFLFHGGIEDSSFLAASVVAVLAAALIGYWLGSWYLPVEGERPGFELITCPLLVLFLAVSAGSATVGVWHLWEGPSGSLGSAMLLVIPISFSGAIIFVLMAWPAILVSFSLAGIALALTSRSVSGESID
ncbi:MAG: hypothetical protein NVV68_00610 [Dokdonella sp.]|nr:hypothetical protein [Dokdonella sp.]